MTSSQVDTSPGTASADVPAAVVVHGNATPEELAALVVVLSAASGGESDPASAQQSTWASHSAILRRPVGHGPGAWRTSLRP